MGVRVENTGNSEASRLLIAIHHLVEEKVKI